MANYKDGMGNYKGGAATTVAREIDTLSSDFTTTSATYTAVTGLSVVLSNVSGTAIIILCGGATNDTATAPTFLAISDDGTEVQFMRVDSVNATDIGGDSCAWMMALDGSTITVEAKSDGTETARIWGGDTKTSLMVTQIKI